MSPEALVTNVGRVLDPALAVVPDRPALIMDDGTTRTFAELEQDVRSACVALSEAGVGPGDRVVLVDNMGVLAVATIVAAARLGAAAAELNPALTRDELSQLVEAVGADVAVAGDEFHDTVADVVDGAVLASDDVLGHEGSDFADVAETGPTNEAVVLFTSGTTGLPKPVPITHAAIGKRLEMYAGGPIDSEGPGERDLVCVPIFHIGGTFAILLKLRQGKTMVALRRFDAGAVLRAIEQHDVGQTWFVPTMLQRVLDHPDFATTDLSSLSKISYGAAAMPPELIDRAVETLPHVDFANTFGQTETIGAYTALGPDGHRDPERRHSVGQPLPGMDVKIMDPETGTELPRGEVGEIWVRNAGDPDDDAWLHTGDLARMDAESYVFLAGRMSVAINRGGEKFAPSEVEDAIRSHPAVSDVAVAGVPDPELGQRVGALVVASRELDLDELREHCADRLARFKLPERVVLVDELPYTAMGKVKPRDVVAEVEAAYGS